jgi:methyltransferase-like protein/SAM-dependent methyltransferase
VKGNVEGFGPDSYDVIPYTGKPFPETHPNTLATITRVFGMTPPGVAEARVLEIGCATGANLIPMACALPDGSFLGIDQSARQVAEGRATIEAVGLRNIALRQMSVEDAGGALGIFDYIICHGVYSWVLPEVQQRILALIAATLAPNGVAFVSYNLYPGWHLRGVLRDAMLFHADGAADPREALRKAREILDSLVQFPWAPDNYYLTMIQQERENVIQFDNTYVLHEFLETVNQPLYFHQFVEQVASWGLKVVADAEMARSPFAAPDVLRQALARLSSDPARQEQYYDLMSGRMFRRSLLCHERAEALSVPSAAVVEGLHAALEVMPGSLRPGLTGTGNETFRNRRGETITIDHPVVKAAVLELDEQYPRALPFRDLWERATGRLIRAGLPASEYGAAERRRLAECLLTGFCAGWVELHSHVVPFVPQPGERPSVTPLARHQARSGVRVANRQHESFELSRFERQLLALLDGRRLRSELADALEALVADGTLTIRTTDGRPLDAQARRAIVAESLDLALTRLARLAFLVS